MVIKITVVAHARRRLDPTNDVTRAEVRYGRNYERVKLCRVHDDFKINARDIAKQA